MAGRAGDQGANGTTYVNINATGGGAFDRVVAISGGNSFEFDDVAFNETFSTFSALAADPIPEPMSLGLVGIGLLTLGVHQAALKTLRRRIAANEPTCGYRSTEMAAAQITRCLSVREHRKRHPD